MNRQLPAGVMGLGKVVPGSPVELLVPGHRLKSLGNIITAVNIIYMYIYVQYTLSSAAKELIINEVD